MQENVTKIHLVSNDSFFTKALTEILLSPPITLFELVENPAPADVLLLDCDSVSSCETEELITKESHRLFLIGIVSGEAHPFHVSKPFYLADFLERLQVLKARKPEEHTWIIGEMHFKSSRRIILQATRHDSLTDTESALLTTLCKHPKGLTREELLSTVLGYAPTTETHALESHLYRLRKKLSFLAGQDIILFQQGRYCLVPTAHPL